MPQALEVLVILLLFKMGVGTPSQAQLHQPRSVYISSLVRLCTWMMDEEDPPEASLSPHFQLNTGVPMRLTTLAFLSVSRQYHLYV